MNDFTKEELEQIYYHMENEPNELGNKIIYMIDNYCDHNGSYQVSYGESSINYCDKCKCMWKKE